MACRQIQGAAPVRYFALDNYIPTVIREDGKAFSWLDAKRNGGGLGKWGQISVEELRGDKRIAELSEAEFKARYPDADLRLEMTPNPELKFQLAALQKKKR